MNTVIKLKKLIVPGSVAVAHATVPTGPLGPAAATGPLGSTGPLGPAPNCNCNKQLKQMPQSITPTESARLKAVLTRCPYHYVNGLEQPMTPDSAPVPVITVPASQTTAQLISATIAAATTQTAVTGRFIEYFPPPVPPPQQLQPGFVKYNINYGPKYVVPPCVGPRLYRA